MYKRIKLNGDHYAISVLKGATTIVTDKDRTQIICIDDRILPKPLNGFGLKCSNWTIIEEMATLPGESVTLPEYIECIKAGPELYCILGRVYKCAPKLYSNWYSLTCNVQCDSYKPGSTLYAAELSHFKPSTKEAYDAQVAPVVTKQDSKFKVGDYVVITEMGGGTDPKDIDLFCSIVKTDVKTAKFERYTIEIDRDKIGNADRFVDPNVLRHATPEEIAKNTSTPDKIEFKKDDYIVITGGETHDQFKLNHIFKQRENRYCIAPYIDSCGSSTNSWSSVKFDGTGRTKWRFATSAEILIYESAGKPVDVTKSSLPNSATSSKRISELKYPDVIHIESKENYDKLVAACPGIIKSKWDSNYKYYLIGNIGYAQKRITYERSMYTIYEMDQVIFEDIAQTTSIAESPLEYAKRMYPIGTVFIGPMLLANTGKSQKCIVSSNSYYTVGDDVACNCDRPEEIPAVKNNGTYLYYKGKWGEIISTSVTTEPIVPTISVDKPISKEELIIEAKRRYPIGTKFISWDDDNEVREILLYGANKTIEWYIDGNKNVRSRNGIGTKNGKYCSNPSVYKNGKWAEIVSTSVTADTGTPITKVVVKESLIAEAKQRGFLVGAKVSTKSIYGSHGSIFTIDSDEYRVGNTVPDLLEIRVRGTFYTLHKEGVWATIEPKVTSEVKVSPVEVFPGIYVDDIVVSLNYNSSNRKKGDMFKVLAKSRIGWLSYSERHINTDSSQWRKALPHEAEAFERGVKNINELESKPIESVKPVKPEPMSTTQWRFKTREEFEAEYGTDWRKAKYGGNSFPSGMDCLLGIEYTGDPNGQINYKGSKSLGWGISTWMITNKPLPTASTISNTPWIPQIGEWVYVVKSCHDASLGKGSCNNTFAKAGDVFQVTKNSEVSHAFPGERWIHGVKDDSNGIVSNLLRKAEPHEIPTPIGKVVSMDTSKAIKSSDVIGRRVRILPGYISDDRCGEGTITSVCAPGHIYKVTLDTGRKCSPYAPHFSTPQCEFIVDPVPRRKDTDSFKTVLDFGERGDYGSAIEALQRSIDGHEAFYGKKYQKQAYLYMTGIDPYKHDFDTEPQLISLDDDISLIPYKEERHQLITLE